MNSLYVFIAILLLAGCHNSDKEDCSSKPPDAKRTASEDFYPYNSIDTTMFIHNSSDTIVLLKQPIQSNIHLLDICGNCVYSGSCGTRYLITSKSVRYSNDSAFALGITNDFNENTSSGSLEDQTVYSFSNCTFYLGYSSRTKSYSNLFVNGKGYNNVHSIPGASGKELFFSDNNKIIKCLVSNKDSFELID